RPNRPLRLAIEVAGLGFLVLFFLFAVSSLVNVRPTAVGAAPQLPPLPSPTTTPTLPVTPEAGRTPTLPAWIDMNSSQDAVRLAISEPNWKTLWVEAEIDYAPFTADTNQPDKRLFTQAWLEKGGRGLVLSTDFMRNAFNFNLDFRVSSVVLFDRKNLVQYNMSTGQTTTAPVTGTTETLYPLAGSSPALDLVYPGFLAILSSEPRPPRSMEALLGRQTVVADWGNSRLWIDSQTGLLLKAERYTGQVGNSPIESILTMRQVLIDPPLDDAVFAPPYLNELSFRPAPSQVQPGPTPTPFANSSQEGWVYLQAAGQAPFEWKAYILPAGCLAAAAAPCPEPQILPGNPNLQIAGLSWAPDHSLAVFSDTNHNQIVAFDPVTRQWPRVLPGFFQTQLEWSPDGTQIAALTEGVDPYDMRLVVIQRDGWTVHDVPTTLMGEKRVLGWLDNRTLAVIVPDVTFKGQAPAWAATDLHPGIYRIDVETGQSSLLPVNDANPYELSLSPDGKQFVYRQWIDNRSSIVVASPDGNQSHLMGVEGNYPTWSADGQWILFQQYTTVDKNQPTINTLFVAHTDGSGLKKVLTTTATVQTAWSPDAKNILVCELENASPGSYALSLFNVQNGSLTKLDLPSMTTSGVLDLLGWQP
ncbi:MAG TPA: hypothetical protein VF326_12420, partial [Anaerolineaceae bacterium]